jgi:hypothetical protein
VKIPTIIGTIDRRILINYHADKDVIRKFLPAPFTPKLVKNKAVVGICLIRLKNIRPQGVPFNIGITSENGAHRIAVQWTEKGQLKEGVYVPRRDTSSRLNALAGGRIFPGAHHLAHFVVDENNGNYNIQFESDDATSLAISARETNEWNSQSVFEDKTHASEFFRQGSIGYSPNRIGETFDGLELKTKKWEVTPLAVASVKSSFFENKSIFPEGSIAFDNALLMRNIEHEWNSKEQISAGLP